MATVLTLRMIAHLRAALVGGFLVATCACATASITWVQDSFSVDATYTDDVFGGGLTTVSGHLDSTLSPTDANGNSSAFMLLGDPTGRFLVSTSADFHGAGMGGSTSSMYNAVYADTSPDPTLRTFSLTSARTGVFSLNQTGNFYLFQLREDITMFSTFTLESGVWNGANFTSDATPPLHLRPFNLVPIPLTTGDYRFHAEFSTTFSRDTSFLDVNDYQWQVQPVGEVTNPGGPVPETASLVVWSLLACMLCGLAVRARGQSSRSSAIWIS